MLLCLLLSILSATFTVSDKNRVTLTGDIPEGSDFTYSRSGSTGQKGQMTAGNSTTLCLSGWTGCTIRSVTLSMRSNSASGAGRLYMTIGDKLVWGIHNAPFEDAAWNGAYSTAFVNISRNIRRKVTGNDEVKIKIKATENSLYIASYTIYYTPPVPQAYHVDFVSGVGSNLSSITESAPHSGVVLPALPDTTHWHFAGWSESEVIEGSLCPSLYPANTHYFPREHCTLYAVYVDAATASEQVSEPQSGRYSLIHNSPYWGVRALCGGILPVGNENKTMYHAIETLPVIIDTTSSGNLVLYSEPSSDMVYRIKFISDSTLTISQEATNLPIGYKGKDLCEAASVWKYRFLPDNSMMLYFEYGGKLRYLTTGYGVNATLDELVGYIESCNLSTPLIANGISIFPITSAVYTTWPFGKFNAVRDVIGEVCQQEVIVPFGIYRLCIRDGKKYLYLQTQ